MDLLYYHKLGWIGIYLLFGVGILPSSIGEIRESPHLYQEVRIKGEFWGWRGDCEHPKITTTDWVIKDKTGSIYVTGMWPDGLDPYNDRGRELVVRGMVKVTEENIPYLEVRSIKVIEEKHTSIGEIIKGKDSFLRKKVKIEGRFMGWSDQEAIPPRITRSDWAIRDETGSIYIVGIWPAQLDPVKDMGKRVVVKGTVKTTDKDAPYIEAHKVEVKEGKGGCKRCPE